MQWRGSLVAVSGSGLSPVPPGLRNIPGQIIDTSKSHQARNKTPWRATDGWTVSLSDCLWSLSKPWSYLILQLRIAYHIHISYGAFLNSLFQIQNCYFVSCHGNIASRFRSWHKNKSNIKCSYVEFVLKCHHFQCPSLASKYLQFPRCLTFYDLTF